MINIKKKIILFIVEGITDQTCLAYLLSKILNSSQIEFALTRGDITSRNGINISNIVESVGNIVKDFSGKIFKANDFIEVVHLIDMDGAFIGDRCIVSKNEHTPVDPDKPQKPYYDTDFIYTNNIEAIKSRNHQKSGIINKLITLQCVWKTVPYSLYYFSCNLDHVLHNERNLLERQKYCYAEQFETTFGDSPSTFIDYIKDPKIGVSGDYIQTWDFIRLNNNSLNRFNNFHLFFHKPKNAR